MDANTMYYGGLVVIAILAYMSYNSNRMFIALLLLALGGYFIYSHNTGNTITGYSDKAVDEFDKNTGYKK
ncbi:MAG: hypothetical protein WBF77_07735 [Sulfurimonadaceae bacterium]